ncbi:MAG: tRNA (N6-isopentenyl adenosine(37)-C2)-methylthiotransferase MiaB [Candidatus Latescibacteria bacterium]|nr:tRNA (N6-isopentenyl adenosine(37)-C2)-methylthiotransferase MiaB [Candidatus Latescibacterota bacterium]
MRRVYIETYGCQMNVADSELVASILRRAGHPIVTTPEAAEVILLNTCAVREHAEERVIGRASQLSGLRAHTPNLTLGILGCMAQHLAESLPQRAPFVDLVMGPDSYRRLPQILAETSEETLLDVRLDREEDYLGIDPVRRQGVNAWVTIMRGCDKFCTFCIVPFVRGRERSVPADEILRQVRLLAAEGYQEVTLLGQTVNSYRHGEFEFGRLLRAVGQIEGLKRLRFTSPHPADFTPEVIAALAEVPVVCPGLHLPLQSGSDRQLELMRRGYTVAQYRALAAQLREAVPGLTLTTDLIAGFCGETEEEFQQTLDLVAELRFDAAFTFKYSPREGTHAHKKLADDLPEAVKTERLERLIALQERISWEINQGLIGTTVEVLVEGPSKRQNGNTPSFYGRTPQGKTVVFAQEAPTNTLVPVHLHRATSHTLFGELARV